MNKRFALIGAAGYIAPRHMQAIRDTDNVLIAALDPHDSVGIIDSYFPDASFFKEFERFDRHIDLLRREGEPIEYVTIASPNYLHDSHIRFALRSGAYAICEKPLVLNPWNIDGLEVIEQETGCRVNTILQLRLHPNIIALKQRVKQTQSLLGNALLALRGVIYSQNNAQNAASEAVRWFSKAAQQGHVEAQNELGRCFGVGKGVGRDPQVAPLVSQGGGARVG